VGVFFPRGRDYWWLQKRRFVDDGGHLEIESKATVLSNFIQKTGFHDLTKKNGNIMYHLVI
jgi:hypothetical protein